MYKRQTSDIWIGDLYAPPTHLATLGNMLPQLQGQGLVGITVLACSPLSGLVVVAQDGYLGERIELWVLDATTGAVDYHRSYPRTSQTSADGFHVVASRDGKYLAETDSVTGDSTIRRWSDDSTLTVLSGEEVHDFSWNGDQVVVVARQPGLAVDNFTFQNPAVIDLKTGRAIWQAPVGARWFGQFVPQPAAGGLALGLSICAPQCQMNLWLIGSDGKGRELDHNVLMF